MSSLAPLAELTLMRTLRAALVGHALPDVDAGPFLQAIDDALLVALVERRLAEGVAVLAALVVDARVVLLLRVHADGDGHDLARPPVGPAIRIVAAELARDRGVVRLDASVLRVLLVEGVGEVVCLEKSCDGFVLGWVHRPWLC